MVVKPVKTAPYGTAAPLKQRPPDHAPQSHKRLARPPGHHEDPHRTQHVVALQPSFARAPSGRTAASGTR